MSFPWICFKCGHDGGNKAGLVNHIVTQGCGMNDNEFAELTAACKEVAAALGQNKESLDPLGQKTCPCCGYPKCGHNHGPEPHTKA
jgi:hypothetical protein